MKPILSLFFLIMFAGVGAVGPLSPSFFLSAGSIAWACSPDDLTMGQPEAGQNDSSSQTRRRVAYRPRGYVHPLHGTAGAVGVWDGVNKILSGNPFHIAGGIFTLFQAAMTFNNAVNERHLIEYSAEDQTAPAVAAPPAESITPAENTAVEPREDTGKR